MANHNTFSGSQSVSFQDIWWLQRFQEFETLCKRFRCECVVGSCRYIVFLKECLSEIFAPFQHGRSAGWSDHMDISKFRIVQEEVVDAFHKWIFGSHDHHLDSQVETGFPDRFKVVYIQLQIGARGGCPGITRCNVEIG